MKLPAHNMRPKSVACVVKTVAISIFQIRDIMRPTPANRVHLVTDRKFWSPGEANLTLSPLKNCDYSLRSLIDFQVPH